MNKQLAMVKGRVYWKSIFGTRCDDYTHEQLDKVQINNKFANWNETLEKKNGNGDPVLSKVSGEPLTEEINLFHVWRKSPCRLDFEHRSSSRNPSTTCCSLNSIGGEASLSQSLMPSVMLQR